MSREKDLSCGETTPGPSIMTMLQLMHHYCFVAFWPTRTKLCFLSHPAHLTSLRQTYDNAPAHASLLLRGFLANTNKTVPPQPQYSPDLTPAGFFLLPKLKSTSKGRRFQTIKEITENSQTELRDPEKGVPGLFPGLPTVLEALHKCRRGVI
jgi:hypothetical protein